MIGQQSIYGDCASSAQFEVETSESLPSSDPSRLFDRARAEIPVLLLLHPKKLPGLAFSRRELSENSMIAELEAAGWPAEAIARQIQCASKETCTLATADCRSAVWPQGDDGRSIFATHDAFFNIRRVSQASADGFIRSILQALLVLHQELAEGPTSLTRGAAGVIERALVRVLAGPNAHVELLSGIAFRSRSSEKLPDRLVPMRWIRGHHIFAALSQSLIYAFSCLDESQISGTTDEQGEFADLITDLLSASGMALRLAGDFDPDQYEILVKVSMMPPHLPEGFSGTQSLDHHYLVRRMREARPVLDKLKDVAFAKHEAIGRALGEVYDEHKNVCAQFAGVERASLLMAGSGARTAVEQIDAFKSMRLRSSGYTATE